MATFNVAAAFGKKSSSQDYGFLTDQLTIMESELRGDDGSLSASDFDVLISNAQKTYAHPGLTPAQRSNIEVKIAGYKTSKRTKAFNRSDDLAAIDRDLKNNNIDFSSLHGDNPENFMKAKELSLLANLRQLEDSIQRRDGAGEDSSAYWNKRNILLEELTNLNQAQEDSKNYKAGSQPTSNMRAYITTNSKGQIVNVDVLPFGSKSGHIDTNRVYGGLLIAGKPNNKLPNGNVSFRLGNEDLVASGSTQFDPATGSFTNNNVLKPESEGGAIAGFSSKATTYKSVSDTGVTTQKTVYPEQFLRPVDSKFIYRMNSDGNYTKYASTTPENLGITKDDILPVSSDFESNNISPYVKDTVFNGPEMNLPLPPQGSQEVATSTPVDVSTPQEQATGSPKTPAPIERSPKSSKGIAGRAVDAAKGFLSNLFR